MVVAAAALVLGACSGHSDKLVNGSTSTTTGLTTPVPTTAPLPSSETAVDLYFVRGDVLGVATRDEPTTSARYYGLESLFGGPNPAEKQAGLSTDIPTTSQLEGMVVVNGVAYVDVNQDFFLPGSTTDVRLRLAQVVYTLTAFTNVNSVEFLIHDQKLAGIDGIDLAGDIGRSQLLAACGPFLLETPAVGSTASSPLPISGTANFNGEIQYQLLSPAGQILAAGNLSAVTGQPFSTGIPFSQSTPGNDTLNVFTAAAGSQVQQVADLTLPFKG